MGDTDLQLIIMMTYDVHFSLSYDHMSFPNPFSQDPSASGCDGPVLHQR